MYNPDLSKIKDKITAGIMILTDFGVNNLGNLAKRFFIKSVGKWVKISEILGSVKILGEFWLA